MSNSFVLPAPYSGFPLFKAANTAPMRPGARRPDSPRPPSEEEELKIIFDRFSITDDAIGAASSFGKVYRGNFKGFPVAIKIEKKGTDSEEFNMLQHVQQLRAAAPADVRAHLPVIFAIDGNGSLNYYIMELLVPAPESVLDDVFGGSYSSNAEHGRMMWPSLSRRDGENDKDYSERNDTYIKEQTSAAIDQIGANPAELNMQAGIVNLHSDKSRWSDQKLIDSAFNIWYEKRSRVFGEVAMDPSADDSSFRSIIKQLISSAIWKYLGSGKKSVAGADTISQMIKDDIMSRLAEEDWRQVWEEISPSLPELLFAISRATWLSVWHPKNPKGTDYAKLRRTPDDHNFKYREALQSTLDWLAEQGLAWGDVHAGNIMMRPGTREIVFIDFGLYSFITN